MNKEEFERELRKKQKEHLAKVQQNKQAYWQPCLHDLCEDCHGTGVKLDGSPCMHAINCPCPKCSPYCATNAFGKPYSKKYYELLTKETNHD